MKFWKRTGKAANSPDQRSPNPQVAGTRNRIARSACSAGSPSISDDVQLRSPSVAPSLRAQRRAEIGRALRGDACGPELQPELEPVVKPKGSDCRRQVISGASHRHLCED